MKKAPSKLRAIVAASIGLAIAAAPFVMSACVGAGSTETIACPPFGDFDAVSAVLESRCGSLDCHGSGARPLKIYSGAGLRLVTPAELDADAGPPNVSGGAPTTAAELQANYESVCGLEPEKTALVATGKAPVETLTLVRKPRLLESHKGGRVWAHASPGELCLTSWLTGDQELSPCAEALSTP